MTEPQPSPNGTRYVPFADGPTDIIPEPWAEDIIRLLYAHHRGIFAALMVKRLGVEKLPRNRADA
jgi:hypothetical protein